MKRKSMFEIPHMFYLKRVMMGKKSGVSMYVFNDYRNSANGVVYALNRDAAKRKVKKQQPDAEFFR